MTTKPNNTGPIPTVDQAAPTVFDSDDLQLERLKGLFNLEELESIARSGFDTYKGNRSLEFRTSLEVEFKIDTKDSEPTPVESARVLEQREEARKLIETLRPADAAQKALKEKWLTQVDNFGAAELVNFALYNEFSTPQLGIPSLREDVSLEDVDAFSRDNGWLEWRFGTDIYQAGYYDNEGVAEIRLTPTTPTELARRADVIRERLRELSKEFGIDVSTSVDMEHINFSAYDPMEPSSRSIFGHKEEESADTIDAVSGMFKAHQDGINLNPKTLRKYEYLLSKHGGDSFRAAPTRRALRVLDGRLELRSGFYTTEQGIAWLAAGTIEGLAVGAQQLEQLGSPIASYVKIHEVKRSTNFDKNHDLQIQRAFETATSKPDGGFEMDIAYGGYRGDAIERDLFGGKDGHPGIIADMVLSAAQLNNEGTPYVTKEGLLKAHHAYVEHFTSVNIVEKIGELDMHTLETLVTHINERLKKVKIEFAMAVLGESERILDGEEAAIARLTGSKVVSIALGNNIDSLVKEIGDATQYFRDSKITK